MKRIKWLIPLLFIFASCAGLPDRASYIPQERSTPGLNGLEFGMCHAGYSQSEEEYALIDQMGIDWLRVDFRWRNFEPEQGLWDFSSRDEYVDKAFEEGKRVLAILDYDTPWIHKDGKEHKYIPPEHIPDFLNFVETVVKRYGDKLGAVEIWNEPNTSRFWTGSDEEFFELTRKTLDLLEEIAPDLPVAVGSVFYFHWFGAERYIEKLAESGALDKADALAIHPYSISERVVEDRVTKARNILLDKGYDTPLWITEMGFPTGGTYPHRVGLNSQAEGVAKTITRLAASGVEMIVWYTLFDSYKQEDVVPGLSSEAFFGLIWPDYRFKPGTREKSEEDFLRDYKQKPGAVPYSILAKELAGTVFTPDVWDFDTSDYEKLYQAHFLSDDNARKIVLWSSGRAVHINPDYFEKSLISIRNLNTGEVVLPDDHFGFTVERDPLLIIIK